MESKNSKIIVCGLGWLGWPVLQFLQAAGWSVVAIDNTAKADDPRLGSSRLISGDFRDPQTLEKAGIGHVRAIMILTNDDLTNLSTVLAIRRVHKDVQIIVRLFNQTLLNQLRHTLTGVTALSTSSLTAPLFASVAMTGETLGVFESDGGRRHLLELVVEEGSPLVGKTLPEVQVNYPGTTFIKQTLEPNGHHEEKVHAGDRLLLCAEPTQLARLQHDVAADAPVVVLWANSLWRWMRTIYRTWEAVEWHVKLSAVILFSVMLVGSLFFWLDGLVPTWPRGFLRTISVMVTSADLREAELKTPFEQFMVSFLKFAGIVLTAAFTALLTNYLVRAKLAGIFAIRQIPESGHIVLCGLGTVGIRIVEELRKAKAEVVVIERNEQSRFLTAARQFGAVVLIGDATLKQTLERARASKSMAVIASTSNDLINIEVTLLARELNPKLRLITRMDDPELAVAFRETANVRFSLSISQVAAPAFVASLYQDRVLSLFVSNNQLWSAAEVRIQPGDTVLAGSTVGQAAQLYHFKAVMLTRDDKVMTTDLDWQLLQQGDQLVILCLAHKLERFIQIETELAIQQKKV